MKTRKELDFREQMVEKQADRIVEHYDGTFEMKVFL